MIETTCACMILTSLFTDFRRGDLTYRAWIPYDYSSGIMYYITYFHQLISLTAASIVNVACDSLMCGLLLHIYCQIEILECRLKKCLRDRGNFGECVQEHDLIYKSVFLYSIFYAHNLNTFLINLKYNNIKKYFNCFIVFFFKLLHCYKI